jgi:hypothetical protein
VVPLRALGLVEHRQRGMPVGVVLAIAHDANDFVSFVLFHGR